MAVIAQTTGVLAVGSGPTNVTRTTLTASDTLTYQQGGGQQLSLYNTTASPVTVTLTGSAPGTASLPGYGPVSAAGGRAITVPANGWAVVKLDDIALYLASNGTVTVTNGTGLSAALYI